jgi:hypothetical protein
MKIFQVGVELFLCGRTNMTQVIVAFHNFANALKNNAVVFFYECRILWTIRAKSQRVISFLLETKDDRLSFFLLTSCRFGRHLRPHLQTCVLKSLVSCQGRASQTFPGDLSSLCWQKVDLESALPSQTDTKFPTKENHILCELRIC